MREMKDSGIEWIGDIPNDWNIISVKDLFYIGRGRVIAKTELEDRGSYPIYSSQTKNNGCLGYISTYDFDKPQLTWTTDGANAGTVFYRDGQYNCTNVCGTLLPKTKSNNLFYLKYALEYIAIFHKRADINGFKIMNNEMAKIKLTIPSFPTQQRIADYLDEKCAEIDATIEKTKDTIEEYKRLKYAMVADAVTKGISNNIFNSSKIDWIGEVPTHWKTIKLKYLFSVNKRIANSLGHDVLSVTQTGLKIKNLSNNEGQVSSDYSKYQFVNPNDFVMNHMDLLTGWVDCSKFSGVTSPDYRVFALNREDICSKEYYLYIFQLCYKHKIFFGLGQGVSNLGRWRLQTDKFINFELPLPPLEEQLAIAEYLDRKCVEMDTLITKKQAIITELENYKKSLIYECVTGKVEV